ncbi:ABC transporter permease [Streptomyces griseoloalbus]|uniref:ABC transporter permease n=1 Tax=Streptomyces griseoloalbus TaxID=67303 RepID=UPI0033AE8628
MRESLPQSVLRVAALVRHDLRLHRADLTPLVTMTVMPLLIMAFVRPLYLSSLSTRYDTPPDGVPFTGAELAVPGVAVIFSFFLAADVGYGVFREHGWRTWDRLRTGPARPFEVLAGRAVVPLLVLLVQLALLFTVGGLLFGLRVRGSYAAIAAVGVCLALCLVAFGFVLVALCRTVMQLNVFSNVAALLFAGLGGTLAPVEQLPGWVQALAHVTPTYWAMRGFTGAVLDGDGLGGAVLPCLVLLAIAAVLTVAGLNRFRFEDRKVSWS